MVLVFSGTVLDKGKNEEDGHEANKSIFTTYSTYDLGEVGNDTCPEERAFSKYDLGKYTEGNQPYSELRHDSDPVFQLGDDVIHYFSLVWVNTRREAFRGAMVSCQPAK